MFRRMRLFGLVCVIACIALACQDAVPTATPEASTTAGELNAGGPRYSTGGAEYPLHVYGDETDNWAYITSDPTYVELVADVQSPQPYDDDLTRRTCPNEQYVGRNAHLRMDYGLETLDFDFRGPFTWLRHVSLTSPYPTALYRFNRNAYTRDNKYYAPAGNNVLLACDGRYVARNRVIRLWVGHLYGKLYNGPIVLNPDYDECEGGGGGAGGVAITPVTDPGYDPYDPGYGSGGDCAGGSNGEEGEGGEEGSGIQFEPGDYTDGETVDWATGRGNGGSSACGAEAVVDYVCIEWWDGENWVTWGCGYITTC